MKSILLLFIILIPLTCFGNEEVKLIKEKDSIEFFSKQAIKKEHSYKYNRYENIFSGLSAFVIGNIGYLITDNSVLKLTYSGIQTIGIINIGRGIYKSNSPSVEKSFYKILSDNEQKKLSKSALSDHLVRIFAEEERAKRLALFYSSTFLTIQYSLNIMIYDSPERIENIYIFLGGVNAIVAAYSVFNKGEYEDFYYGKGFDLNPLVIKRKSEDQYGLAATIRF